MPQLTIDDIEVPIEDRVDRVAIAYVPDSHATNALNATTGALDVTDDEVEDAAASGTLTVNDESEDAILHINNRKKHAAQELVDRVATLPVKHVVTEHITKIAPNLRDTVKVIEYVTNRGANIYTTDTAGDAVVLDGGDSTQALVDAAKIAKRDATPRVTTSNAGEEYQGRPGLGFKIENGYRVKTERFDEIRATLAAVNRGDMSKRAAGDRLDTSRRTITRCIEERPEEYDLK